MRSWFFNTVFSLLLAMVYFPLYSCNRNIHSKADSSSILSDTVESPMFRAELWQKSERQNVFFVVRLINKKHTSNPLRYSSTSLEEYQLKLGDLLTTGKTLFKLSIGEQLYYPVSCTVTPGFGAVPVDEIIVGFGAVKQLSIGDMPKRLLYDDRYFFGRTLVFKVV